MATITAAAGGGNWTTGGTWVGGVAPGTGDDALLTGTSGNVTIDAGAVCRSLNCTGYTGTLSHNNPATLTIGDGTAGLASVALKLVAGMTYAPSNGTQAITFVSTSGTVQTIDFGGKSSGNINFSGAGSSYQLTSGITSAGTGVAVVHNNGTLDTNGQSCTFGTFNSANANTRTLTLGASAITILGTSNCFVTNTVTGLTMTANTAVVTFTGANANHQTTTFNYNGMSVVFTGAGSCGTNGSTGSNATYANFTRTGTAIATDILNIVGNVTCTGIFTCNGQSSINRVLVQSSVVGTSRTITAATVTVTNSDFMDITGAGAGSWNLSAVSGLSGDAGGNSGITFTTAVPQTWVSASGGNWSTAANWTSRVPLPQDTVSFANAFSASQSVTVDIPRLGAGIDWTGVSGNPTWVGSGTMSTYGSVTLTSGMIIGSSGTRLKLGGRAGPYTITSVTKFMMGNEVEIVAPGAVYSLSDNLKLGSNLFLSNGTFDANNFNVQCATFGSSGTLTRTLKMGSGTWSLTFSTGATSLWNVVSTGLTYTPSSAPIVFANASTFTRTFTGGGLTYQSLTYTVAGSTGALIINNSNTFTDLNFSDVTNARTLQLSATSTQTITGSFNVNGTSGKLMTINSTSGGSAANLVDAVGTQSCDFLSIQDSAAGGGASWYAGANSTDVSGNSGWIFTAPPAASSTGGTQLLMGV